MIKSGTAKIDITPSEDVYLTGFVLRDGKSIGVLHKIFARAIYIEHDDSSVLIILCELLGFDRDYVNKVRSKIKAAIPKHNLDIMLACTHTHSGPATQALLDCGEIENDYLIWLEDRLVDVAQQATQDLTPVTMLIGRTQLTGVSENRREEGGPIDPELLVVSMNDSNGKPLATFINYACHPTSLQHPNMKVSGDFPGYTMHLIEEWNSSVAFFFNGATGNIRPIRRNSLEAMRFTAESIADAVKSAFTNLEPIAETTLVSISKNIQISYEKIPTEADILDTAFRKDQPPFYMPEFSSLLAEKEARIIQNWQNNTRSWVKKGERTKHIPIEIQIIRLGPLAILGIGGELFVELGLRIKENADSVFLMISCYTNDNIGYIPSRQAYQLGGYEVTESYILYNKPAKLDPSAGELIVEDSIKLLRKTNKKKS